MDSLSAFDFSCIEKLAPPGSRISIGFDLVLLTHIRDSLQAFGEQFESRLFTHAERNYANSAPGHKVERLAARFAAKEATIKALQFSNSGINWRDIEVCRQDSGHCSLQLHGSAAQLALSLRVSELALSLSHDGGYAGAVVAATTTH